MPWFNVGESDKKIAIIYMSFYFKYVYVLGSSSCSFLLILLFPNWSWALVKDKEVARKMTEYMQISSIGVSKESQLRAAKILGVLSEGCQHFRTADSENFFEYSHRIMRERRESLQNVVKNSKIFSLPKFPQDYCNFTGKYTDSNPGNARNKMIIIIINN